MVKLSSGKNRPQAARPKRMTRKPTRAGLLKTEAGANLLDMFDGVEKQDLAFVVNGFKKSPSLLPWIASLMREGVLLRSLSMKMEGTQPMALGRKLPPKCKRLRNLSPRFWELLWVNIWATAEDFQLKENKLTVEEHQSLAEWGLRVVLDAFIPSSHKAACYEGPLIAVLVARHVAVGSPFAGLTMSKVLKKIIGYFHLGHGFAESGEVIVNGRKGLTISAVSSEVARSTDDWKLEEITNFDARLVSANLSFSQGLFTLLHRQHPSVAEEYGAHDDAFEYPDAADSFPDPKAYDQSAQRLQITSESASSSEGANSPNGPVIITPIKKRRSIVESPTPIALQDGSP